MGFYPLTARRKDAPIEPPPSFANAPIAEAVAYLPVNIGGVTLHQAIFTGEAINLEFAGTNGFAAALSHYSGAPVFTTAATGVIGIGAAGTTMSSAYDPTVSGGSAMADMTREEIDAKIAASERGTETKIARLEGKMDLVLSKLDSSITETRQMRTDVKEDSRATRANQWVIFFGLAGIIIAALALIVGFFTLGTQFRDVVHAEVQSQMPHTPASTTKP